MDAGKAKYQFGQASKVTAEAIGEPGQRTFRLDLESGAASASLWLEKEQLNQLGLYIQEIVSSLGDADKGGGGDAPEPPWSGGLTNVEFKVGRLALGQDRASNCLLLLTYDVEDPDDSEATPQLLDHPQAGGGAGRGSHQGVRCREAQVSALQPAHKSRGPYVYQG